MTLAVKLSAATAAFVGISGLGYGISTIFAMPNWTSLQEDLDTTYSSSAGTDNIGKLYSYYLVGIYGKENEGNKNWWKWSYKNWKKDFDEKQITLSNDFKDENKVSEAYKAQAAAVSAPTTPTGKELNLVCADVYAKTKDHVTPEASPAEKANLRRDLFKYCSPLGKEPTTIKGRQEEGNYPSEGNNESIGKKNKDKLISVLDSNNYLFWKLRNKEFYEATGNRTGNSGTDGKEFKSKYASSEKPHIKTICQEAYKDTTATNSNYPNVDVIKFCSLDVQ